jgi:hypothetical protein
MIVEEEEMVRLLLVGQKEVSMKCRIIIIVVLNQTFIMDLFLPNLTLALKT